MDRPAFHDLIGAVCAAMNGFNIATTERGRGRGRGRGRRARPRRGGGDGGDGVDGSRAGIGCVHV